MHVRADPGSSAGTGARSAVFAFARVGLVSWLAFATVITPTPYTRGAFAMTLVIATWLAAVANVRTQDGDEL